MPDWLLAPICLVALLGVIGYAFYQGMRSRRIETIRTLDPARMMVGPAALTAIPEVSNVGAAERPAKPS
ncbi:hypothetical protein ABH994_005805 [Bradyrhizobium yuanmingense]|uniref:hypothetical protein n=1 Tax=Bradyrhizobium yuanmingense TaxID=108015 RepID=UPI003514D13D